MLHILLTILKIIGIILLIIIGLVLLICACILFVPVRYNARITYKDKLVVKVQITYLLHAISAKYWREGPDGKTELRIFGFKTHFLDKEKKKKDKKYEEDTKMFEEMSEKMNASGMSGADNHAADSKSQTSHIKEYSSAGIEKAKSGITENGRTASYTEKKGLEDDSLQEPYEKEDNSGKLSGLRKIKAKFQEIISKIKYRFKKICGTIRKVYKNIKDLKEFISDERTKKALSFVKEEAVKLIKHIKPKKVRGYLNFGFNDPSHTGKMLGLIYMFSRGTKKDFQINPDFENKFFETDVQIKGRIQIYFLLIIAYRFYKNKNFREVIERRRTYGRE